MNLYPLFSITHLNTGLMPYYWTHFPFYISLGKYKLSQIWSSLTCLVSSALCFLNKATYLLAIIIRGDDDFVCVWLILWEKLFVGEKLSYSSSLCFNERIFNPIIKRMASWRKVPIPNFSLNQRVTAMSSPHLTGGRRVARLIGETRNGRELDIRWALEARGCGCTETKSLGMTLPCLWNWL